MELLKQYLSPVYQAHLPRGLRHLELEETAANCDDCTMSKGGCGRKVRYRRDLKCCTYEPFLPNFLVGGILSDPKQYPQAVQVIRQKIERRRYALPIGLVAPVRFQVEFNGREPGDFGNKEEWLCPYFDRSDLNCSIWKYRGHVCTSFYCRSSYGKKGLKFWDQLGNYLAYVEMALMEEALVHLDFSPRQVTENLSYLNRQTGSQRELTSWSLPEKTSRKLWNFYYDEQENFYIKTFEFVRSIKKAYFEEALGETGRSLEAELLKLGSSLKPVLKQK